MDKADKFANEMIDDREAISPILKRISRDHENDITIFQKGSYFFKFTSIEYKKNTVSAKLTLFDSNDKIIHRDFINLGKAVQRKKVKKPKDYEGDIDHDLMTIEDELIDIIHSEAIQGKNDGGVLENYKNIVVLGELDAEVALYSKDTRKTRYIRLKDMTMEDVISLTNVDPAFPEELTKIKKEIAFKARENQISDMEAHGQGIWYKKGKLLIINGDDAFIWKDGKIKDTIELPIHNNTRIMFQRNKKWLDVGNLNIVDYYRTFMQLYEIVTQWNWANTSMAGIFTALLFALPFQHIWDWRPHIYITGRRGVGKSTLVDFIFDNLFSNLGMKKEGNVSEAGLRQDIKSNLYCTCLDEFEKMNANSREAILKLLRISNKGGTVTKGTPSGKSLHFDMNHMITLASIDVPLRDAADISRFILFDLKLYTKKMLNLPNSIDTKNLFHGIIASGLHNYKRYREVRQQVIYEYKGDLDARLVECYAVPLSIIKVLLDKDPIEFLQKIETNMSLSVQDDEERLIETIINTRVTIHDGQTKDTTVGNLIMDANLEPNKNEFLQNFGLSVTNLGDEKKVVAFHAPSVERELLKDTEWRGLSIKNVLSRIPGAKEANIRFSYKRQRVVCLPIDVIVRNETGEQEDVGF